MGASVLKRQMKTAFIKSITDTVDKFVISERAALQQIVKEDVVARLARRSRTSPTSVSSGAIRADWPRRMLMAVTQSRSVPC